MATYTAMSFMNSPAFVQIALEDALKLVAKLLNTAQMRLTLVSCGKCDE